MMGVVMRACIGVMAVLLFSGCITTLQKAEVLPGGENSVTVAYGVPFFGEVSLRRGIGWNSDVAIKAELMVSPIPDWYLVPMVSGELKYQILGPPYPPLAFILGGGAFEAGQGEKVIIDTFTFPTLLASYGRLYLGARYIFLQEAPPGGSPLRGVIVGLALGPYKGFTVLTEVNIHTSQQTGVLVFAVLGIQR